MKYQFNITRFSQLIQETGDSIYRVQKKVGRTNRDGIQSWIEGKILRGEDIIDVCNGYGISPLEFFLQDGSPLLAEVNKEQKDNAETELLKLQLASVSERAELEKAHAQAISTLAKDHLRELMQKDIDLAKKEIQMRDEIRHELKAEYEERIRKMREEYEEQIRDLRNQLLDLTTQYRELEILGGRGPVTAVAECKGSNYMAGKK